LTRLNAPESALPRSSISHCFHAYHISNPNFAKHAMLITDSLFKRAQKRSLSS
jgi:hypothetical protein